jgi:hypothetical protein
MGETLLSAGQWRAIRDTPQGYMRTVEKAITLPVEARVYTGGGSLPDSIFRDFQGSMAAINTAENRLRDLKRDTDSAGEEEDSVGSSDTEYNEI